MFMPAATGGCGKGQQGKLTQRCKKMLGNDMFTTLDLMVILWAKGVSSFIELCALKVCNMYVNSLNRIV